MAALSEAMNEIKIKTSTIVTRNEDESIEIDAGTVQVVPAWRFLLGLPDAPE